MPKVEGRDVYIKNVYNNGYYYWLVLIFIDLLRSKLKNFLSVSKNLTDIFPQVLDAHVW